MSIQDFALFANGKKNSTRPKLASNKLKVNYFNLSYSVYFTYPILLTLCTHCIPLSCSKSRSMNFNFPPKTGTGISKLLPHDHVSKECIELIELMCAYDPDER